VDKHKPTFSATERELLNDDAASQTPQPDPQRLDKSGTPGKGPEGIIPDLQSRVVVGVFDRHENAESARDLLYHNDYSGTDISIVMQPIGSAPETPTSHTKAEEGTAAGATTGAVLGGAAGLAALLIPGIGPVLAAGPIAVALGALVGGALGGLVGSFTGLGIPTEQAKAYEEAVRGGGIVMTVRAADQEAADRVSALMREYGASETASYTEEL
jgi:hypothetical protein